MSIVMSFASLGSYRLNTMRAVKQHFGSQLSIYSGDRAPEASITLIKASELEHDVIRNFVLPRAVVIQKIPILTYLRCNVLLLDLNPRMPLVWILLIVRNLLRKRTLLWGHAFPRLGRHSGSEKLRKLMRGLASGLVAYTRSQAHDLKSIHPTTPVWAAPNALYPASAFGFDLESVRSSFIYVGRLHLDKKPLLMISAFELAFAQNDLLRLVIVGDGPLADDVRRRAALSPASDAIQVLGHLDDYGTLRKLYAGALASVSPGYVGLSVTQSLSFGVPMIISRDEPHAPELEAVTSGHNGEFFETDDARSLAARMTQFAREREIWAARGPIISQECAEKYSVEAMVAGLVMALEGREL